MRTADSRSASREGIVAIAVGLFAVTVLLIHARSYLPLVVDDALISLRYARRLLQGRGLTWNDGEAVEGYSNLLWVLGCAALGRLGMDLIDAARVLGLIGGSMAIAALVITFRPREWSGVLPAATGGLFLALAGPVAIWSIGGLEGGLVAGLLAWAVALLRPLVDEPAVGWKRAAVVSLPLALLCLTRVDGPLFTVVACLFFLVSARPPRDGLVLALKIGVVPGLATLGQMVFRIYYYHDWISNTVRAKVAFTGARAEQGFQCVSQAGAYSYALWIPAVICVLLAARDRGRRARVMLTASLLVAWTVYSATVSCRPFGYRMLIPSFVLLAFLAADLAERLIARHRQVAPAVWIGTALVMSIFGWSQQQDPNIAMGRGRLPTLTWKGSVIGNLLKRAFQQADPLVAIDAAGAVPYFSEFRSLDMLGLNDAHLTRHRPEGFGQGLQGHELGDGDYVLSREPDIIVAGILGSKSLSYHGGREMMKDPRFNERYRMVRMWGDDPIPLSFIVWIRLEGPVGVQRSADVIRIPGYLLAGTDETEARFHPTGVFGTRFEAVQPGRLFGVEFPPGRWRLSARGIGTLQLRVRVPPDGETVTAEGGVIEIVIDSTRPIDIAVIGSPESFLANVFARRIGD